MWNRTYVRALSDNQQIVHELPVISDKEMTVAIAFASNGGSQKTVVRHDANKFSIMRDEVPNGLPAYVLHCERISVDEAEMFKAIDSHSGLIIGWLDTSELLEYVWNLVEYGQIEKKKMDWCPNDFTRLNEMAGIFFGSDGAIVEIEPM